jgi:hypothetical protein
MQALLIGPPTIEVADDRNLRGIGRPDGKVSASLTITLADVSAEFFIDAVVIPFPE